MGIRNSLFDTCGNAKGSLASLTAKEPLKVDEGKVQDLWESLQCPICFDMPSPPIMQCQRGHNICKDCKPQVQHCPTCKSTYVETRNYSVEAMIKTLPLPCKHRVDGCTFTGFQSKIHAHEPTCEFKPYPCPEGCDASLKSKDALNHFSKQHRTFPGIGKVKKGKYKHNFFLWTSCLTTEQDKHILFVLDIRKWGVFLLTISVNDGTIGWILQMVAPQKRAETFRYEMRISAANVPRMILFNGSVSSLHSSSEDIVSNGECLLTKKNFLQRSLPSNKDDDTFELGLIISKNK